MNNTPVNKALRQAFLDLDIRQVRVARLARINETRFSKIVRGHIQPNQSEKLRISGVLQRPVDELFPEEVAQ